MQGFFISGTDTNVGKTIVSAILVNKLNACYYKPIQSGSNINGKKDSDVIRELCPNANIIDETYNLKKPASPNISARNENIEISMNPFLISKSHIKEKVIIEGAGGLQVPINNESLVSDLMIFFNLPLILVSRTCLGTINHTLMSLEIIKKKKIPLKGIIFVGNNEPETIETIKLFGKKVYGSPIKILGLLPIKNKINSKTIIELEDFVDLGKL